VALACAALATNASLPRHYPDREVVARAELIVVAKMKPGSLIFVRYPQDVILPPDQGDPAGSPIHVPIWEHRLELLVSEVLKGQMSGTSMVVRITGQLQPLVGRHGINPFEVHEFPGTNYSKDMVELFRFSSSNAGEPPVTGDIRTNHIWLLRRNRTLSPDIEPGSTSELQAVYDPEDVQPISKRSDLLQYLK
jgi:hypothetical protein